MLRTIIGALVGALAGVLLGVGITLATVGLLPFVVGGTLTCSVDGNGAVTTCTNGSGQHVTVPHHIRIQR
jgi:hypothetical protein